ncbi:MAG TPA: hypothetical protein VMV51_04950 [Gemmatimonadaceae bacterium]|nr:hypothetical protein [Gemmatimonadaceae bacterium]
MSVLVGMNFYPATGDAGRRQDHAIAALRGLANVSVVNLQWPDAVFAVDGIPTVARLQRDSRTVSGCPGRRKPIISEMLQILATEAMARGCRQFLFANADIEITPAAIAEAARGATDGCVFVRTDLDPVTRAPLGVMRFGVDAFAFDVAWWQRHRKRFRAYIAGEPVWDNVYTAILLTHSNARFLDGEGLVLHERHESPWRGSPFDDYTWYLAALDRPYFARWAAFHAELTQLAKTGPLDPAAVRMLRERVFTPRALWRGRPLQWARALKAGIRYAVREGKHS